MCVKLHVEQAPRSKKIRIQSEITERRVAVTKGKGQKTSPSGRQESASSGRHMGLVQKGTLCSFLHSHASGIWEILAEGAKNTGVSSLKPAVDCERRRRGKGQASFSVPTGKGLTTNAPATGAKIHCLWGGKM